MKESASLVSWVRFAKEDGNCPLIRELSERSRVVSLERLTRDGGIKPEKLQSLRFKCSNDSRFPIEVGISPKNPVFKTAKYLRGLLQ